MCSAGETQPSHTIAGYWGFPRCYETHHPLSSWKQAGLAATAAFPPLGRVWKPPDLGKERGTGKFLKRREANLAIGARLRHRRAGGRLREAVEWDGGVQGRPGWLPSSPRSRPRRCVNTSLGGKAPPNYCLFKLMPTLFFSIFYEKRKCVKSCWF